MLNNIPNRTYPLIQPRISALVKNVANPQTSLTPYYLTKRFGATTQRYEATEQAVQFLFEQGNWRKATRQGVRTAAIADRRSSVARCSSTTTLASVDLSSRSSTPTTSLRTPWGEDRALRRGGRDFQPATRDLRRRMDEGEYYECSLEEAGTVLEAPAVERQGRHLCRSAGGRFGRIHA